MNLREGYGGTGGTHRGSAVGRIGYASIHDCTLLKDAFVLERQNSI